MSWDTSIASTTRSSDLDVAVWSPCNRFIAIAWEGAGTVDILDSTTLQRLQTLESPQDIPTDCRMLVFSPDSHILTCSSTNVDGVFTRQRVVVSWDLQTGGVTSIIKWEGPRRIIVEPFSIMYAANGKMVGGSCPCRYEYGTDIFTCDVASGVLIHSDFVEGPISLPNITRTHGEFLRFASVDATAITIWEVEFAPGATPTKVETFPAPDGFDNTSDVVRYLPTPCRLALFPQYSRQVLVWDVRTSRYLLKCADAKFCSDMAFSSDGRFFACSTAGSDIYLWKESPGVYTLHKILPSSIEEPRPLLAQNGESIIGFGECVIQLWYTNVFTTPPSNIPTQAPHHTQDSILEFSPDGTLAVVAEKGGKTITILNLKSGVPRLIIDANMEVHGFGIIGKTIVVLCDWKVVTWDLPVGDCIPGARVGLEDSSSTKEIRWEGSRPPTPTTTSISPDLRHIAFVSGLSVYIYNTSTEEYLWNDIRRGQALRFSPDGCDLWSLDRDGGASVNKFSREGDELESSELTVGIEHPPEGYPWGSTRGYRVTNDWWILGPDGKRLLLLPPPWQSYAVYRVWEGQFLVLLHGGLPEPVILELGVNRDL